MFEQISTTGGSQTDRQEYINTDTKSMADGKYPTASPPPASSASVSTTTTDSSSTGNSTSSKSRRERPCDVCRRRKSRCVMREGSDMCEFCRFHNHDCTFVQSPQPRKKRVPVSIVNSEGTTFPVSGKKRPRPSVDPPSPPSTVSNRRDSVGAGTLRGDSDEEGDDDDDDDDDDDTPDGNPRKPVSSSSYSHGICLGSTTEYESALIALCPFDDVDEYTLPYNSMNAIFRQASEADTFLMFPRRNEEESAQESADHDRVDRVVRPHGRGLINLYFRVIHSSFPILQKSQFFGRHRPTPLLLSAVYLLALNWWEHSDELVGKARPDGAALERLAKRLFSESLEAFQLSTIQAGLLLLQRPNATKTWILSSQVVALAQELGLHLDCSKWRIPRWEKGLRRRLAWGVHMQDKWAALICGRPSHLSPSNWGVKQITSRDFRDEEFTSDDPDEADDDEEYHGRALFTQMIELSQITAEVLDGFFTVERAYANSRSGQVEHIEQVLERAKPVQIKLKEWYARLPECLRMDSEETTTFNSNGYLHISYFATEITLHRAIIRSLDTSKSSYLIHICRTAAKTRLISAMDFVNRLKPEHLRAFWYSASTVSFALIGTFGTLLWATSEAALESEFYKARLDEYRWTLLVSSKGANFMHFAVKSMDSSAAYCTESVASAGRGDDAILPSFKDMAFKPPPPPIPRAGGSRGGDSAAVDNLRFLTSLSGSYAVGGSSTAHSKSKEYRPGGNASFYAAGQLSNDEMQMDDHEI